MLKLPLRIAQTQCASSLFSKTAPAGTCFVHITVVPGQHAGVSNEVCLYTDADWLKLTSQSQGGERLFAMRAVVRPTSTIIYVDEGRTHSFFRS